MFELNANLFLFVLPLSWGVDRLVVSRKSRVPTGPALLQAARGLPGLYILVLFPWAALNLLDLSFFSLAGFGVFALSLVVAIPVLLAFKTLWDRTVARR
ncbi:hypothetical protein [Sphingomonas sp. NIBR02145]|uniref:hypothetical protein n=1 Tax=Sphingomonas sp. NIBR02145 TaxID=3014784 RepID=UPI0022B40D3C|nr:hypothetical protein [Sphingomonas sp. NIBR02145]WHU01788.1 hypothetical protein O3305_16540 [Sphingomonas sp. NIBR02145]